MEAVVVIRAVEGFFAAAVAWALAPEPAALINVVIKVAATAIALARFTLRLI
jgi:hypothetical protein